MSLAGLRANIERHIAETCAANVARFRSERGRAVNQSSLSDLFISFLQKVFLSVLILPPLEFNHSGCHLVLIKAQTISCIVVFQHKPESLRVGNLSIHGTVGTYKQQYKMVASNLCDICNSHRSFSFPPFFLGIGPSLPLC